MIRGLNYGSHMPWIMAGDFNQVVFEGEKKGENGCDMSSIMGFCSAIDHCELKDIGFIGYKYIWSNKRGDIFIEERLVNAVANEAWLDLFPQIIFHPCENLQRGWFC